MASIKHTGFTPPPFLSRLFKTAIKNLRVYVSYMIHRLGGSGQSLRSQPRQSGFTLIELLVVIAIIGILASTALASLTDARASANFVKMKQDMRQIATAAELFAIKNKLYPCDVGPAGDPGSLDVSVIYPGEVGRLCSSDETLVGSGYLPEFPTPPCDGWTYDWENWGPTVLPTGTSQSHIVRISMRTNTAGVPNVYYYCIKDSHGSEDFTCGGRAGDVSTTIGGQEITQLSGGLYCNVPL